MRDYGELKIPTERLGINPTNGQFLKGHVPFNRGRKWHEYMKKRAMKRAAKGWKLRQILEDCEGWEIEDEECSKA